MLRPSTILLTLALSSQALLSQDPPADAPAGMSMIDEEGLKEHAEFLASDELGGRYTGTPGQVKAAEYIAKHFEKLGLQPLGDGSGRKRSFFQKFPLVRTYLDPKGTSLSFGGKTYKTGFAVTGMKKGKVRVSGRFVFCESADPKNLPKSLKRKIPMLLIKGSAGGPRGGMRGTMELSRTDRMTREMERRGAKVVLFLIANENSNILDAMNRSALLPGKHILEYKGQPSRRGRSSNNSIARVYLPPEKSRLLMEKLGWDFDATGATQQIKKNAKASGKVNIQIKLDTKFRALNVCAVLKGAGSSRDAVIYSAHMDHMGTRIDGDAFNGADDNASGTSGLLEIAEAFAQGPKPRKSVIFLAVSGEELGLWGSHYYSEHPTWPVKRIIANINIDMIGRNTQLSPSNTVSATPSPEHRKFSTLVQDAAGFAEKMGMRLTSGDTYYQRSDHYNFAKKGIPVVFFCDGEHEDYHKVTDHADKLDYGKMERIARLAYWTGFHTADAPTRPRDLGRRQSWTK